MPKIVYFGPARAHAPGVPAFDPGEARDVGEHIAARLLKNRHFGLVETDPPASEDKPPRKKAPPAPEGNE